MVKHGRKYWAYIRASREMNKASKHQSSVSKIRRKKRSGVEKNQNNSEIMQRVKSSVSNVASGGREKASKMRQNEKRAYQAEASGIVVKMLTASKLA